MSSALADLIHPEAVIHSLRGHSRKDILAEMAAVASRLQKEVTADQILAALVERESDGSTAIGHGVALPHARLRGLTKPILVFGRAPAGIDFDADDEESVDLVFLILAPAERSFLRVLARVAQVCQKESFCDALRETSNATEVYQLLMAESV